MQSILRSVLLLCLLLVASVVAAPGHYDEPPHDEDKHHPHNCSVAKDVLALPPDQTVLSVPAGVVPEFIALGTGVQNYTCSATTLTYTSIGALAKLYDIGCLFDKPVFAHLTDIILGHQGEATTILSALLHHPVTFLGSHFFITNPVTGVGINPTFDFRDGIFKGDPNAFFVGTKVGDLAAPTSPATNVDWLELNQLTGSLAKNVFRVVTAGGQPPTSCTAGSPPITVPYAAQYWFFAPS